MLFTHIRPPFPHTMMFSIENMDQPCEGEGEAFHFYQEKFKFTTNLSKQFVRSQGVLSRIVRS